MFTLNGIQLTSFRSQITIYRKSEVKKYMTKRRELQTLESNHTPMGLLDAV